MNDTIRKVLRKILKIAKVLGIIIGVLWVIVLVVLQLVLTEKFLRSAADKYLPEVIDGADVTFSHIKASAIKSFPNLRVEIDSLCITYPHDRWAAYDSLPGVRSPLAQAGRGEEKDTLAFFTNASVSVSYIALLKGTISLSDVSLTGSRIFVRQFDSLETNLNVFKFMTDTTATPVPEEESEPTDLVFHHIGLGGRTLAVYTNTADTVFAAIGSRKIDIDGTFALVKPFGAKLNVDIDSTFVSGRTATDTIAAGFKYLNIERSFGYHHLKADGATFVAMGGSGRMMLPVKLDGRFKFPGARPDRLKIKNLRLSIASFSMAGESEMEFMEDSLDINARILIDTCNAGRLLKDFAPLLGPESKKISSDANLSLTASCDGILSLEPFRLPPLTAELHIPDSKISYSEVPESGRVATDIKIESDKKGFATASIEKLLLSFAGASVNGNGIVKDLTGDDPLLNLDATASADLKKLSVFLPDGMTAEGRVDAKLKGQAKVSEFGPGRFAGANLDGYLVSEGLQVQDSTMLAYLGKTDVQLTKKPLGKGKDDVMLIVEGQVDSVYATIGPVTRIRGKALDIAISDIDASVHAERLSMVGEDSLFVALKNSRNYVKISKLAQEDGNLGSISVSSDNEGIFLRSGKQFVGLRGAQLTTNGSRLFANERRRSRREKVLDSLQRIWPGTPRDSLFHKMMRQRGERRRGRNDLPDYMKEKSFSTQDISFRLDESLAKYFREWDLDGYVNVEQGFASTPSFPLRTRLSALQGRFNNNEIVIDSIGVRTGRSDISAHAKLSGLRRALLGRGTVKLDANVYSKYMNANEILAALDAGQKYNEAHSGETVSVETEASEGNVYIAEDLDTTAGVPLLVIPANINLSIGLQGDTIHYSTLLIDSFRSKILMKDRCLQVSGTTATSNMGRISLEGFYATRSKKDLSVGFDLNLNDITGEKVITMIPQVDTLIPLLKSFKGMLDCEFAATSALDTNMNFIKESINGLMQINGRNLEIEQNKAVRKVTRLLLFKNKQKGAIDEMSVKGVIKDNELEIFPFNLAVDRYRLALGGTQNFDGEFQYHISVLKSPIPWKFGINLKGNFDKWKLRFGGAKYKKIDTPVYTKQLDTARTNLLTSIRSIFDKGVELAVEESRDEFREVRRRLNDVTAREAAADTVSAEAMTQKMDSLRLEQSASMVRETVPPPDSLDLSMPKTRQKQN
ncbi:MAG: hypothetical protein IJ151_00405 [Bacteroidales bacterium]|nr:hypothetical protein [Bacteroidales bacterium]